MGKNTNIERNKEAGDFSIEPAAYIGDTLENYWIPEQLGIDPDYDKIYIRKVGDHLEIGKFDIEFIR